MNRFGLMLILVTVLLTGLLISTNVSGYGQGHPDSCQPCHGNRGTVNDVGGNMWDHNILDGQQAWSQCTTCHQDYVANTPHANVGCQCHSIIHIGYNNTGTWAAWVYAKEPSPTTLPAAIGDVASFQRKQILYTDANATATIRALVPNEGMEIEVGLFDAWNNEFIPINAQDTWKVCFNCHFLASDPTMVGAYKLEGGVWKVGIPEYTLELDPHEITEVDSIEPPMRSGFNISNMQVIISTLALASALYILFRRFT